ncbi:MAG TPA: acyloxyacyl hydrolase, partial [Thermoanaerobaculia bacterium]|nr:acyloxyacyl hydrolase [Thermoanaerobaculia bacterium]
DESVRAISAAVLLRRNFFTDARVPLYGEVSSGPMWSERRVPAATSRFNFNTQLGGGAILFAHSRAALLFGYRFMHISNGGYAPRNPGLNVHSLLIGARFRGR